MHYVKVGVTSMQSLGYCAGLLVRLMCAILGVGKVGLDLHVSFEILCGKMHIDVTANLKPCTLLDTGYIKLIC